MIKKGSRLKVKYVNHKDSKGTPFTTFSIGDKVKNGTGWQNYTFMVWGEHVKVIDGDKVEIDSIESIGANEYNGKVSITIFGKAHLVVEETGASYVADAIAAVGQNDTFMIVDDDTSLPFEL